MPHTGAKVPYSTFKKIVDFAILCEKVRKVARFHFSLLLPQKANLRFDTSYIDWDSCLFLSRQKFYFFVSLVK